MSNQMKLQETNNAIISDIARMVSSALNVHSEKVVGYFENNTVKSDILHRFLNGIRSTIYFFLNMDGNIDIYEDRYNKSNCLCVFVMNTTKKRQIKTEKDISIGSIELSKLRSSQHGFAYEFMINYTFLPYIIMFDNTLPCIIIEQMINLALAQSIIKEQDVTSRCFGKLPIVANLDCILNALFGSTRGMENKSEALKLEVYLVKWTDIIEKKLNRHEHGRIDQTNSIASENEYISWERRKHTLESFVDQLQSTRVRKILKALDNAKSTLNKEFALTCKKLFWALTEAKSNARFLKPLLAYFQAISTEADFSKLPSHFHELIFLFLCVWNVSTYYNTKYCLVTFFRRICNYLVSRAKSHLMNSCINEDTPTFETISGIIHQHEVVIKAIGSFKSLVLKYKKISFEKCPKNPWNVDTSVLIDKIDVFLDKCQNVNEILKGVEQYSLLSYCNCGGFIGSVYHDVTKQMSQEISNIYLQLRETFAEYRSNVLGHKKSYERKYILLKRRLLLLDNQFGALLQHMFTEISDWRMKMKILSTFSPIISKRKVVLKRLETCINQVIQECLHDVKGVKSLFIKHNYGAVFVKHASPITGALVWYRTLVGRAGSTTKMLSSFDFSQYDTNERILKQEYIYFEGEAFNYGRHCREELLSRSFDAIISEGRKRPIFKRLESSNCTSKAAQKYLLSLNLDNDVFHIVKEIQYRLRSNVDFRDQGGQASCVYQHLFSLLALLFQFNRIELNSSKIEQALLHKSLQRNENSLFLELPFGTIEIPEFNFCLGSQDICTFIGLMKRVINHFETNYIKIKMNLANINLICIEIKKSSFKIFRKNKVIRKQDLIETIARIEIEKKNVHDYVERINSQLQTLQSNLNIDPKCKTWNQFVQHIDGKVKECLNQALIDTLCLFESTILLSAGNPSISIELDYMRSSKKSSLEENEKRVFSFFDVLSQRINAIVRLYGSAKRIDSRRISYLQDMFFSSSVILVLSRIQHKIALCLCKTKELMKTLTEISIAIADGPRKIRKCEKKDEEGVDILFKSVISNCTEGYLKYWISIQDRIHNLRDEYDIDFVTINIYKAKISYDIETFNSSNRIIKQIIRSTKVIETKLINMERTFEPDELSPNDVTKKSLQFNSLYSEIERVGIFFKHNNIISENFNRLCSQTSQVRLKWQTKLTNTFRLQVPVPVQSV